MTSMQISRSFSQRRTAATCDTGATVCATARVLETRRKRQQGDVARLLDGASESALVRRAHTRKAAGYDFAALGHEALQQAHDTVGDGVDLLGAELPDLLAPEEFAAARTTGPASTGSAGARPR